MILTEREMKEEAAEYGISAFYRGMSIEPREDKRFVEFILELSKYQNCIIPGFTEWEKSYRQEMLKCASLNFNQFIKIFCSKKN